MSERASCWSITINNPTEEDSAAINKLKDNPWFVEFKSQLEQGDNGTPHIQGMLKTSRQRFGTIKKALPRAHIEIARNVVALTQYVQKADTRLEQRQAVVRDIPTLFEYQATVAGELTVQMIDAQYDSYLSQPASLDEVVDIGDVALQVVDKVVAKHIRGGMRGVEYIATNPMWRSAWKRFWRSIIERNGKERSESEAVQGGS